MERRAPPGAVAFRAERGQYFFFLSLNAFVTTDTLESDIQAAASIGGIRGPPKAYKSPQAIGII